MPNVTYNSQCFSVDGPRLWVLGASLQYTRIPPEQWKDRIAAARQAGFNTIETACPWLLHEPRRGRYDFKAGVDVSQFVALCGEAGMRVILRIGPYVGAGFDGGGLPAWLLGNEAMRLREANPAYMDRVGRYFRKLCGELSEQPASKGGPILLVQIEHAYTCGNDDQSNRYLRELARIVRECGMGVPLINSNNLWLDPVDTIDTWRDDDNLIVNLRQLRAVQPNAPRIASAFETPTEATWGRPAPTGLSPSILLRRTAEILAAGAQPIITPFHGGTNFGFMGGQRPGPEGGTVTTSGAGHAPLGEAGARGASYLHLRRLMNFASAFAHVFADLDPDYQPVAVDPTQLDVDGKRAGDATVSIVPLRGASGRVVFVFGDGKASTTMLLLDSGLRLPINLGSQPVGWYLLDADVHGRGRLDYSNLCPFTVVDRTIVVFYGPARMVGYVSVDGTPLEVTVPTGAKPTVVAHKSLTLAICNETHVSETYHDDKTVYFGAGGLDADGHPRRGTGARVWALKAGGELESVTPSTDTDEAKGGTRRLATWDAAPADAYADGTSPRYASLPGPRPLAECGATAGYGWYRVTLKTKTAGKRLVSIPAAGHRLHVSVNGSAPAIIGHGPGASPGPLETSLPKGAVTIVVLADNTGRQAEGNELETQAGLGEHLYALKRVTGAKAKTTEAEPVDPFSLRQFILGAAVGQLSVSKQVTWTFAHSKKTPILLDVIDAEAHGTFVLNDVPIAYFAGARGSGRLSLLLNAEAFASFKRGKNVLRFAPDFGQTAPQKDMAAATTLYECVENLTASATWAFAKWEPPLGTKYRAVTATEAAKRKGNPCWWRTSFTLGGRRDPAWLDTTGLSKGHVYLNERNLGRYFTSTATRKAVGPQTKLYLPEPWLDAEKPNELIIFDEHGFSPLKTKIVFSPTGELDEPRSRSR